MASRPSAEVLPNARHPQLMGHPWTCPKGQWLPHQPALLLPRSELHLPALHMRSASVCPIVWLWASSPGAFGVGVPRERHREALYSDPAPASRLFSVQRKGCRGFNTPCVTKLGGGARSRAQADAPGSALPTQPPLSLALSLLFWSPLLLSNLWPPLQPSASLQSHLTTTLCQILQWPFASCQVLTAGSGIQCPDCRDWPCHEPPVPAGSSHSGPLGSASRGEGRRGPS